LSNRLAFWIAVLILLAGAFLRLYQLSSLPPGLNEAEIVDARIAETVRQGRTEIFFAPGGQGREGIYPAMLAAFTTVVGGGMFTMRLLSVFTGMLALAAVYALGKRLYGAPAGLAALALMAVSMLPIVLSRATVAESFAPFLTAMTLLLLSKAYPIFGRPQTHEPAVTTFAMLGGLLGFSFYVTPSAFTNALTAVIFIAYLLFTRQPLTRRVLSYTWFALVLLIVLAMPYLISSLQNPALSGAARVFDNTITYPLRAIIAGVGGIFFVGDSNPLWNLPDRPLLDLVSGLLLLIGLAVSVRGWRQPRFMLVIIALALTAPPALLSSASPDFLRMAPLVPLLMVLFGLGVMALYRNLYSQEARTVAVVALTGLVIFNIQWTMRDLYANWPDSEEMQAAYHSRIGAFARYLDASVADYPTVICSTTLRPPQSPTELTDPQLLALMMHNQTAPLRYADCANAMIFPEGGDSAQVIFLTDGNIEATNPLVRGWLERGTPVEYAHIPPGSAIRFDVADALANTIGAFTTTAPVAFAPESPGGMDVVSLPARFGGNISLLGYVRAWTETLAPGDIFPVPTYWRVDGVVPADLQLFIHVQSDPGATPVAQTDTLNVLPDTLQPRDVVLQVTYVPLPWTIPGGTYSLSVGAYEDNRDVRLPVFDGDEERGNRLFIGEISVSGA